MEFEERPAKKRRFFVEDPPAPEYHPPPQGQQHDPSPETNGNTVSNDITNGAGPGPGAGTFDAGLFEAFVGEKLQDGDMDRLRSMAGEDTQRAINMYLDGSFKKTAPAWSKPKAASPPARSPLMSKSMPDRRYMGAFGVACWATKSGTNLIRHGDKIRIGRAKLQQASKPGRGGRVPVQNRRQDTIVRVINERGEEIGRLETETAYWIAPLLDQKICELEGTCVFAPERVRTNDTMFLQLRAYFFKRAFEDKATIKPMESNRQTGIFEEKETQDERNLHLRQLALVKLFNEINMQPTKCNETTERHKKQGLLKAAEVAEQYDQKNGGKQTPNDGSSPPSEDVEPPEEGEELQQDQLDSLYKKAQSFDFDTPEAQPADTFTMDLRKYQKQALHWMMGKEKDTGANKDEMSMHPLWEEYAWPEKDVDDKDLPIVEDCSRFYVNPYSGEMSLDFPVQEQNCLGGVLADEMGLGKTIEMLSLIHSHKSEVAESLTKSDDPTVNSLPRLPKSSSNVEMAPCTTLVVAPMSLLAQWAAEAERASKSGTLKVLLYYGNDRAVNLQNLCCAANAASAPNVIVTSYGTVLSEYTQVAASGGKRAESGGLFSLDYFRIILDEAHNIKNRMAKTSKACYELAAKHRWVLTGTPIVNRLEDLFSLVHFLKVEPWSNFSFWKTFITVPFENGEHFKALDVVQTVLEPLVLRRTKDMKTPSGEPLVPLPPRIIEIERLKLSESERDVYNVIYTRAKRTLAANIEAGTLMKSYTSILAQLLRLRQSCCHPILTRNKNIVADEEEAAGAADEASGLADDMDLSTLIARFEAEDSTEDVNKYGANALKEIQDQADSECPICSEEPMIDQAVTGCWHSACKKCLVDYIDHQKDKGELPRCFNCREPVTNSDIFEVIRDDQPEEEDADDDKNDTTYTPEEADDDALYQEPSSQPPSYPSPQQQQQQQEGHNKPHHSITLRRLNAPTSAKITALLSHLKTLHRTSPGTKSVIFSQFTSFLDLIEPYLSRAKIPFLRFDGSMAQKARANVIAEFTTSSDSEPEASHSCASTKGKGKGKGNSNGKGKRSQVLLLSLKAGGVGLNLTAASQVYVMDPWWSWAVEAQAIDRVHRMGQVKEVKVVRFVCEGSIEEKMLRIQERKKFLAGSLGMMGESEEERRCRRLEDIRELLE